MKFAYPLPLVFSALEELRGAHIFSKLDLRSAYNLIRIRGGDEWETAFVTPSGHYEYQVMPYGLTNTPSVFQNFVNEILRDMLHKFVIVYIYDILIYSSNLSEHVEHVTQVPGSVTTTCTYNRRNVSSTNQTSNSSVTSSPLRASGWTTPRWRPSNVGHNVLH